MYNNSKKRARASGQKMKGGYPTASEEVESYGNRENFNPLPGQHRNPEPGVRGGKPHESSLKLAPQPLQYGEEYKM